MEVRRALLPTGGLRDSAAVSPLELFFDLVFVFALTQVTATMAANLTVRGIVEGMMVVGLLWWSWTGYAWLGNLVRPDLGTVRLGMFAAMFTLFVLALAIPEAFADAPGGLHGPTVVAGCYFVFRLLHLYLFWAKAQGDTALRGQILRFMPSMLVATALLLGAAATDGAPRTWLWGAALVADYVGTYLGGSRGWRIRSASHFADRHGLIVIVAFGESIVAIGVGVAQLPISWPIVAASLLGLTTCAALWWQYFDATAPLAERALAAAPDDKRAGLARDAYSFLHLPMIAGIALLALGLKKVLEYVGEERLHNLSDPIPAIAGAALFGGVVLFLAAHVAFTVRTLGRANRAPLVVSALLVASLPAAVVLPALASLALIAAAVVALVAFESVRHADERSEARRVVQEPA